MHYKHKAIGRQPSDRAKWHGAACTSRAKKELPAEENHQPRRATMSL
jgi:hypothetical protein